MVTHGWAPSEKRLFLVKLDTDPVPESLLNGLLKDNDVTAGTGAAFEGARTRQEAGGGRILRMPRVKMLKERERGAGGDWGIEAVLSKWRRRWRARRAAGENAVICERRGKQEQEAGGEEAGGERVHGRRRGWAQGITQSMHHSDTQLKQTD